MFLGSNLKVPGARPLPLTGMSLPKESLSLNLLFLLFISLFIHLQAWSESYPLLCGLAYKDAHNLIHLPAPRPPLLTCSPGQSEFEGITFSCPGVEDGPFK